MFRATFVFMLLVGAALPLQAQPAPRPVEDFAALPFIVGPKLSPDDTKLAAKLAVNGRQMLAIVPLFKSEKLPRTINTGDIDLNWWSWVNDEWLIGGIGTTEKVEGKDWYVTRVFGFGTDGKIVPSLGGRELGQHASDVIWSARDGTPRILLSVQRSIYAGDDFWPQIIEVNVATGRWKQVVKPREGVMDWYADSDAVVRMGIGYNDDRRTSRLLYRTEKNEMFRVIDRARATDDQSLTVPAMFLPDPTKAVTFSNHEGYDWIYELELPSLTLGKKLFGVDGYDIDYIGTDADRTRVVSAEYTSDQTRVHWFDADLNETQAALDKAVSPSWATIVSLSRDRQTLLVHVGKANDPGAYYAYVVPTGRMHRVAHVSERLKGWRGGPVSTIKYKARDGLEISAVLTLPPGRDARDLPLIVLPHGGPQARDSETYDWWVQFLADRGYAVVQPNYRGSTGFGAAFLEKGEKQWGLAMQDDLLDAINHLAKQGLVDPKRVCIAGASYGGYAALRGAQRDGAAYRCAISYAGVSSIPAMLRYDRTFLNKQAATAGWKEAAEDLTAVSPLSHPEQFTAPVLIMHGIKDLRVPVRQSRDMHTALVKAGKTVRYIEQPEADHHFSREADRLQFLKEMEIFLKQYNPA
jgi:dipeptidyl aminopeptidase/acylaminoacyl peptidase